MNRFTGESVDIKKLMHERVNPGVNHELYFITDHSSTNL